MTDIAHLASRDGDTASKLRKWSSFIGIITAIVGNILISFALNIQRYAHVRLEREQERRGASAFRNRKERSYGTQQSDIAEERARLNLDAPIHDGTHAEHGSHVNAMSTSNGNGQSSPRASLHSRRSSASTIRQPEKPSTAADSKTYLSSPFWWAGILLMIVGEAGNFLAYGFAPASIVSPLGVVALVSNCIIAPCLLKERFRQRDFWGVVVAVGGAVTVVLSASTQESKMGPHHLWSAITRWEFELYLGITAAMIIVLMWASGKHGDKSILIDLGLVGLFGGYTALSTKGVASLLSDTLWRTLTFPVTYLLVFVLVVTAFLQIRYVNRALQRFDSTQVIPTQFVLFTLSVIIGSAVLYRDFESANADRFGKFIGGCVLTFLGVYLITSARAGSDDVQRDMDIDDEEQGIGLVDDERYEDASSEDDNKRRSSKAAVSYDGGKASKESRHSSRRQSGSLPQTPRSTFSIISDPIDEGYESPLMKNPWRSSEDVLNSSVARPKPIENTISSPLLPSEAQRTGPDGQRQQRNSFRPSTLSRNSMSRMMPGPLISPLSSPLSAIVADSIRRSVDSPSARRRPGLSELRKTRSQRSSGEPSGEEFPFGSSPLKSAQVPADASEGGSSLDKNRSQSMSATLGGFLGFKRDRNKAKEGGKGNDSGGPGD